MRRHIRLSCAIILSCLALAALLTLVWPKSYTATATLSYDPQLPLIKGGGGLAMTDMQRDSAIDAQLAEVTAPAVATDVARSVDVAANPELRREADNWTARSERRLSHDEAMSTALLDHVKTSRVGQTPMFTINFSDAGAIQAALIANDFAASYLGMAARRQAASADAGARQIGDRVAVLRRQANAAERELAAFRLANNLLTAPDSAVLEQEVAALRGQLADASAQAAQAGMRSGMADTGGAVVGGGAGGTVDTAPISALVQQRAAAAAELAALMSRYGQKHPEIIAAHAQLAQLDTELAEALHRNRKSAAVEANAARARARALTNSLRTAETQLAGDIGDDARLHDLQNTALAARLAYQDALKLSADQTAQRVLIQPDAQVTALAMPPLRAKSPRMSVDLVIGLVFGLGAALAAGFIREKWLHTLSSVDDIGRWLETDYFAPLPLLARSWLRRAGCRDPIEAVSLHPQSAIADSFRSLGTAALFAARGSTAPAGRVIGITSAVASEGKTTAGIAMGRVLAAAGMKVAVVDGDPRGRSGIAALAARSGASAVIGGGLALVAGGTNAAALCPDPGELMRKIAALRQDYDVVIIDTAPILPGNESRHLLAGMDALVLLARWQTTPVRVIREAMNRITAAGGQVSGIALSMAGR